MTREEYEKQSEENRKKREKERQEADKAYSSRTSTYTQNEINSRISNLLSSSQGLYEDYQTRYKDGKTYKNDSSTWKTHVNAYSTKYKNEYNQIKEMLESNKNYLDSDWYNNVLSSLDSDWKNVFNITKESIEDDDLFSQFETESDYEKYNRQKSRTPAGVQEYVNSAYADTDEEDYTAYDRESGESELAELQKIYSDAMEFRSNQSSPESISGRKEWKEYLDSIGYSSTSELKNAISAKEAEYNLGVRSNRSERYKTEAESDPDFETYASAGEATENPTLIGKVNNKAKYYRNDLNQLYAYMTDEEYKIYNYYLAKNGQAYAEGYFSDLSGTLEQRKGEIQAGNVTAMDSVAADELFAVYAGLDTFNTGMINSVKSLNGETVPIDSTQYASSIVRNDLDDAGFKIGENSVGQIAYDTISTVANMTPTIAASAIAEAIVPGTGSALGNTLMGISAAGNEYAEMYAQGMSKDQARSLSAMQGAWEGISEAALGSIEKLGNNKISKMIWGEAEKGMKRAIAEFGVDCLQEGAEEVIQDIGSSIINGITTGKYEFSTAQDMVYEFALGALSAFVMNGSSTITGTVSAKVDEKQNLKEAYTENQQELINEGLESEEGTESNRLAQIYQQKLEEGGKLTSRELLKLAEANQTVIDSETETENRLEKERQEKAKKEEEESYKKSLLGNTVGTVNEETGVDRSDISRVESTKNGTVLVMKDGTKQNLSDTTFKSQDAYEVYNYVREKGYTSEEANLLLLTAGEDATLDSMVALDEAFNYGNLGVEKANMMQTFRTEENAALYDKAYQYGNDIRIKNETVKANNKVLTDNIKTGRVSFINGADTVPLSDIQKASVKTVGRVVSDITRGNVYFYSSDSNQKLSSNIVSSKGVTLAIAGTVAPNGIYDSQTGDIYLDLNAGSNGSGTVLYTFSHELLHRIKQASPDIYRQISKELFNLYAKHGVDIDSLVRSQMDKGKKRNPNFTRSQAIEEVVADSMESMFTNFNALEKMENIKEADQEMLQQIKTENPSLWQKIKDFFKDLYKSIKSLYNKFAPDSLEGKIVRAYGKEAERLAELFSEGAVESGKIQKLGRGLSAIDGVVVSDNLAEMIAKEGIEKPGALEYFSYSTEREWENSVKERFGDTPETQRYINGIRNFTNAMISDDAVKKYVPAGSYAAGDYGPIRENQEYIYTFDIDTSCPRTFQFTYYRDAIKAKLGRELKYNESVNLLELMRNYGQAIPCSYCYVENKRVLLAASYDNFFAFRNAVMSEPNAKKAEQKMYGVTKKGLPDASRKAFDRWRQDMSFNPSVNDVWLASNNARISIMNYLDQLYNRDIIKTDQKKKALDFVNQRFNITSNGAKAETEGLVDEWIYDTKAEKAHTFFLKNNGEIGEVDDRLLDLNHEALAYAKSASSAKKVESYVPYTDQLKNISEEKKNYIIGMGGIRKHSSNDFRIDYVQDYFMFFADLAMQGWTGHTYTKDPDYARIFGRTGDRINMSIAFYGNTKEDLRENPHEGAEHKEVKELREHYKNIGSMAMVTSDVQLSYALNASWIDMIIPFHASSLDKKVWYDLHHWFDYTSKQLERFKNAREMTIELLEKELEEAGIDYKSDTMKNELLQAAKEHGAGGDSKTASKIQGREITRLRNLAKKNGLNLYKGKSSEIADQYDEAFGVIKIYDENKRIKPHFLPGDTVVGGNVVPGHHNDPALYKELCRQYGVNPRFKGVAVEDANGNTIDITDHDGYIKVIKETARIDSEQEKIKFNFDEYDEYLGMSPFDYAMKKLQTFAGIGGYSNYSDDSSYNIVSNFVKNYVDKPLGYMTDLDKQAGEALRELQKQENGYYDDSLPRYQEYDDMMHSDRYDAENEFVDTSTGEDVKFSIREEEPPKNTLKGYKVFVVKDGKLYPPMVANPNGADTPVGVWLNADIGTQAPDSKTGRKQVKAGGKGTQGGSGSLAFRPGWHLGETPLATQFDRTNPETGVKELFPENFVWAECDIAADVDYQEKAMSYGYNKNGKFQHSLAGLPELPVNGYYRYRTNPNPDTVPWLITGAMKVNRLLSDAEVNEILAEKGIAPKQRQGGNKTLEELGLGQYEGVKYSERESDKDYAPTFYSHMSNVINDIKPEKMSANGLVNYLKGKGVKDEEIKWSGIEAFLDGKKSVTKKELQEFSAGSMLQIEEQTISDTSSYKELITAWRNYIDPDIDDDEFELNDYYDLDEMREHLDELVYSGDLDEDAKDEILNLAEAAIDNSDESTKWSEYKLDGGSNYRELLFKMPNSDYSNKSMRTHWERNGVLAHARIQDMQTESGGKMLFVEEIQSDWHNAGKKYGYNINGKSTSNKSLEDLNEKIRQLVNLVGWIDNSFDAGLITECIGSVKESVGGLLDEYSDDFTEDEVKRITQLANGIDEYENYDLEESELAPDAPFKDTYQDYVMKRLIRMAAENNYDAIGWTTAKQQEERWSSSYAEGYRIEYDQDIPKFMNKYGKKWGTKVEEISLAKESVGEAKYTDSLDTPYGSVEQWRDSEVNLAIELSEEPRTKADYTVVGPDRNGTYKIVDLVTNEYVGTELEKKITPAGEVWKMDITDAMRNSVLYEGQAMYSDRDEEYLELAKEPEKNKQRLRELVEDAAKEWGALSWDKDYGINENKNSKPTKFYHGTNSYGFTTFNMDMPGRIFNSIFASLDRDTAESYAWGGNKRGVYSLYIKAEKPLIVDCGASTALDITLNQSYSKREAYDVVKQYVNDGWKRKNINDNTFSTDQIAYCAYKSGKYDSVLFKYVIDNYHNNNHTTVACLFDNKQVKSADPVTYDDNGNVIPLSERFNDDNADIRFSERDTTAKEVYDRIQTIISDSDDAMQADADSLEKLVKLKRQLEGKTTNGGILRASSIQAEAGHLKNVTDATKGDSKELAKLITPVYEYIHTAENISWEEIKELSEPALDWIEENQKNSDELDSSAQRVLDTIRGQRIYISPELRAEIEARGENYNEIRKSLMGRVILTSDKSDSSLDSVWQKWSGIFPDVFHDDVNEKDMPSELIEIIDDQKNMKYSDLDEYKYYSSIARQEWLEDIYDGYWDVSTLHTVADKYQAQINRLKHDHNQQMANLRDRRNEREGEIRQYYRDLLESLRVSKNKSAEKRLQETKEYYQRKFKATAQKSRKKELLRKLTNTVKTLNSLLESNTKEKHILNDMKGVVADALDILNMDTVNAEREYNGYTDDNGKYHKGLLQLIQEAGTQEEKERLIKRAAQIQKRDLRMKEKISNLKTEYDALKKKYPSAYDEDMSLRLQMTAEYIGNTPINQMTEDQLFITYQTFAMLLHQVRNANKAFRQGRWEDIVELSENGIAEMKALKKGKSARTTAERGIRGFIDNDMKPVYFFEYLGSDTAKGLFNDFIDGEGKWARYIEQAKNFMEESKKKYGITKKTDLKKNFDIVLSTGKHMSLNLEQAMSIYAYSKREQALAHMEHGGFSFNTHDTFKDGKGIKGLADKYHSDSSTYRFRSEDLKMIEKKLGKLTGYVDDMQHYLSTVCSDQGNEASRTMWGIDLFNEDYYFPLKTDSDFRLTENKPGGNVSLKSSGMTKALTPGASNPIILEDFEKVWTNHVNKMALYGSMVVPIDNFNKFMAYTYDSDDGLSSVRKTVKDLYTESATEYIDKLIQDLNGGITTDSVKSPLSWLVSNYKKTSVAGSFSVVIQQPTAIVRAMSMVNPKYFTKRKNGMKLTEKWEQLKRYAPVAIVKEIGGFDTGSGMTAERYINPTDDIQSRIDDGTMKPAGYADEIGWCAIWDAVLNETEAETKLAGEPLYQKAGERFTDVIVRTQVYDSTLARSGYMRSDNDTVKQAVSFMGEPTTTLNMMVNSIIQANRGNISTKKATETIAWCMAASIMAAAFKSIPAAGRDDDKDKTYWQKLKEKELDNILDELKLWNLVPFVKDIIDNATGWKSERMDTALIYDVVVAFKALDNENKSMYRRLEDFAGSCANLFGIPLKNVMRDFRSIYNTAYGIFVAPKNK